MVLSDGSVCPADLVLVGIGVVPNIELACDAALSVSNGIVVDEHLRTEDDSIYAIGDCADHPNPFADQAPAGACGSNPCRTPLTRPSASRRPLWAALKITAPYLGFGRTNLISSFKWPGCRVATAKWSRVANPRAANFQLFYFRDGRLAAVDSVNRPGDHLAGRKLIGAGTEITPEQAADPSVDLKALR